MGRVEATGLSGACLCGGVRFAITDAPLSAVYCHCTRCQRRTGTGASASAILPSGSFRIVAGEQLVRELPVAGRIHDRVLQPVRQRPLEPSPKTEEVRAVRMGSFDADPGVRPSFRQFTAMRPRGNRYPTMGYATSPKEPD